MSEPKGMATIISGTSPANPVATQTQTAIYSFEKENKAQTISFDALKSSIRRESGLAGIRDVPVQFWTLYSILASTLTERQFNYNETPIYVQWNGSKAYLTDQEKAAGYDSKNAPIDRWRHDKIITMLQMPNISAGLDTIDGRNASIGLSLNKEGLVVAFGMNVHVCQNFSVLGGTVMRSYTYGGREGLSWDRMLFNIKRWVEGLHQIWRVQNDTMEEMKSYILPEEDNIVEELIGDLYIRAIKQAYFKGGLTPFDTHELSNFTKEMIQARKTEDRLANVWDLYNWGTSIMKPGIVDIGEIANNSNLWAEYLIERFQMNVPEAITIE